MGMSSLYFDEEERKLKEMMLRGYSRDEAIRILLDEKYEWLEPDFDD